MLALFQWLNVNYGEFFINSQISCYVRSLQHLCIAFERNKIA